ncbi:MAG: KEOPS complex subunit Pcc1 [Candidatus Bathyarchaeia archaeon]
MIRGARAILRFTFPSEREAEIISKSILPETEATARYRSRVKATREGNCVTLTFESKDTTALRASINSYLSWIILLRGVYSFLESQER